VRRFVACANGKSSEHDDQPVAVVKLRERALLQIQARRDILDREDPAAAGEMTPPKHRSWKAS